MASAMMSRPVGTTGPRLTFPPGRRDCASPRSGAALRFATAPEPSPAPEHLKFAPFPARRCEMRYTPSVPRDARPADG